MIPLATYGFERTEELRPLPTGKGGYLYQRTAGHKHRGIDLQAPIGTPVRSAMGGTVTHAKDAWEAGFTGYGRHVVVMNDDSTFALYAHLDAVDVQPGDEVKAGAQLGTVGNTLFTRDDKEGKFKKSGPHLHFEVSKSRYPKGSEANRIDPTAWLAYAEDYGTPEADDDQPDEGNIPDILQDNGELLSDMEKVHQRLQSPDTKPGNFIALGMIFLGFLWLKREDTS